MSTDRKTRFTNGGQPPLTPAADLPSTTGNLTERQWMRKLLAAERRRHAEVESILTRTVTCLERQVTDLQTVILQMTAEKLTPKRTI